jgi:uncharacterized protein
VKVVADTNVYVSAIVFGGKPHTILDLAQEGQIELFISDDIVVETSRILGEKFHRTGLQVSNDIAALEAVTKRVEPREKIAAVVSDSADDRILECAVAAGADVILSGDKHLLQLRQFRDIRIQRVAEFLASR